MDPRRQIVTDRLRQFFSELGKQVAGNVEELWQRVENKLGQAKQSGPSQENDDKPGERPP